MEDSDKRFPLVVCNVDWTVLEENMEQGLEGSMVGIDGRNVDQVLSRVFLVNDMIAQDLLKVDKCLKHVWLLEVCMKTVEACRKKARLSQDYKEQGWKAEEFCTSILVLKLAC